MKKFGFILCLILIVSSFFMFGCGDKYKNLRIELDKEEINFELSDDSSQNYVEVVATVNGAGKGVSTSVVFTSLTEGINLEQQEPVKNKTTCIIYFQDYLTSRIAQVKVTTKEGNKSKLITINIVRKIKSVSANENYKPAVGSSGSLKITSSEALVLEPQNTTQKDFNFTLVKEERGVTLTGDGELTVLNAKPQEGYITIKATNTDNASISTTFNVYVVETITAKEQITIKIDDSEKLEVAKNKKPNVNLVFENSLKNNDYYTYYIEEVDENNNALEEKDCKFDGISYVDTYILNLTASTSTLVKTGVARFKVIAGITGYDKKYASFTFYTEINIKNVPDALYLYSKGRTLSNESEVNVYDNYSENVLGTDIKFSLTPDIIEEDDSYLTLTILDKELLNYVDIIYPDETVLTETDLTKIDNKSTLYFRIKSTAELSESKSFAISISSNYDETLTKTINLKLTKSIRSIVLKDEDNHTIENNTIKIKKGNNLSVFVDAKDIEGNEIVITKNNLNTVIGTEETEYVSVSRIEDNKWNFDTISKRTGTTEIKFVTDAGLVIRATVIVYEPIDTVKAYFVITDEIAQQITDEDGNVEKLYLVLNSTARISLNYYLNGTQVVNATIIEKQLRSSNTSIVSVNSNEYIAGLTQIDEATEITLTVNYYDEAGEEQTFSHSFEVYCIVPLNQFTINHTSITLKDSDTVSALEKASAELVLEVTQNPVNPTYIEGDGVITWTVENVKESDNDVYTTNNNAKVTLSKKNVGKNQIRVSATSNNNSSTSTVVVTASITQFNKTRKCSCQIRIEVCKKVESVSILNLQRENEESHYSLYINGTKGLINNNDLQYLPDNLDNIDYLPDNYYDIKTTVSPVNANNTSVVYIVRNEAGDYQDNSVLISLDGRVYANLAGKCQIWATPADNLTSENDGERTLVRYRGANYYLYNDNIKCVIDVEVADGSEENPIQIKSVNNLLDIQNESALNSHYILKADIDLHTISEFTPFDYVNGKTYANGFTGSFNGNGYSITNINYKTVADSDYFSGLFINNYGTIKNLTIYANSLSTETNSRVGTYNAFVVAKNYNRIENCKVYINNKTYIVDNENTYGLKGDVYFGAITAQNNSNGIVSNCYSYGNIVFQNYKNNFANLYAGGLVGENNGTVIGKINTLDNNLQFLKSYNFSDVNSMLTLTLSPYVVDSSTNPDFPTKIINNTYIGGIVGFNTSIIKEVSFGGIVTGYSNIGGIAGKNTEGNITNCVMQGNVYSIGGSGVGGIVGTSEEGTISECSVENYNYNGKNSHHTAIVGYNNVGGIVGSNTNTTLDKCYILSYYSLRTVATYNATDDYTIEPSENTYYGDILILNSSATTLSDYTNNADTIVYANVNVQILNKEETIELTQGEDKNTVPTIITVDIKTENETFGKIGKINENDNKNRYLPTKVGSYILLPFFKAQDANDERIYSQHILENNTYNIADLITVNPNPENSTQKYIVRVISGESVYVNNSGQIIVRGIGTVVIEVSSIFNSCEPKTITIKTEYPIGELTFVNENGETISSLDIRKNESKQIVPKFEYSDKDGDNTIFYVVNSGLEINVSISDNSIEISNSSLTLSDVLILTGKTKTSGVTLTLAPNIEGYTINLTETVIAISVYDGATDVQFNQNNITISQTDTINLKVYVYTDKDVDIDNYGYVDDNNNDILTILTETDNSDYQSNEDLVITKGEITKFNSGIIVNYTISLKEKYGIIENNKSYLITFRDSTLPEDNNTRDFVFTVKQQQVLSVYASNYRDVSDNGSHNNSSLEYNPQEDSNYITPGNLNVIEIDIYPFYSEINSIQIVNDSSNEDRVTFEQIYRTGKNSLNGEKQSYEYKAIFPRTQSLSGGLNIAKISTSNKEENSVATTYNGETYYFNGRIYLKALVKSGVIEDSKLTLNIIVTTLDNQTLTSTLVLTVKNSANVMASFEYYVNGETITVKSVEIKGNDPTDTDNENKFNEENTIYLPVYAKDFGKLVAKTIGYNGVPNVTVTKSYLPAEETMADYLECNIVNNAYYTLTAKEGATSGAYAYINITGEVIVNGLKQSVTKSIKVVFVDFLIEDIQLKSTFYGIDVNNKNLTMVVNRTDTIELVPVINKSNWHGDIPDDRNYKNAFKALSNEKYWFVNDSYNVYSYDNNKTDFIYWKNSEEYSRFESATYVIDRENFSFNSLKFVAKTTLENNYQFGVRFNWKYNSNGKLIILSYNEETSGEYLLSAHFTTALEPFTSEEAPSPISKQEEFERMTEGKDYILLNDIVLTNYTPISNEIASLDGNGYNFFIDSFATPLEKQDRVSLGLFNTVSEKTILKNINVVINKSISLGANARSVNYGTIASTNNGVITNCAVQFSDLYKYDNKTKKMIINSDSRFKGATSIDDITLSINTEENTEYINNIAGLVAVNNGYITNSRVEQPSIMIECKTSGPEIHSSQISGNISKLEGTGNIAGLVATNYGKISSCYVKGIQIANTGTQNTTDNTTAGLVANNNNKAEITYSYVEGTFTSDDKNRAKGTGITSNSNIGAFVYENAGKISNCYANIKVSTNARASGFVYDASKSTSDIYSCFTLSCIEQNNNAQTPFTGTSVSKTLTNTTSFSDCYYLQIQGEDFGNLEDEPATKISLTELSQSNFFGTFAFYEASDNTINDPEEIAKIKNKYIWEMKSANNNTNSSEYPHLILADQITLSHRGINQKDTSGASTEYETYIPDNYPELGRTKNVSNVVIFNPYIVSNAENFDKAIKDPDASNNGVFVSNIRVVSDFAFNDTYVNSPLSDKTFSGVLEGNNMEISNIRVNTYLLNSDVNSLGFVGILENGTIKNATFNFVEVYGNQVQTVGGVVGTVINGYLLNIKATGNNVVAIGRNITGGVFGKILGASQAVNLESNLSASSEYRSSENSFTLLKNGNYDYISYAGGIGGIVDISGTKSNTVNAKADIERAIVSGNVYVLGEVVGGVFGYVGASSTVRNLTNIVNPSTYLFASKYAGGVVGEVRADSSTRISVELAKIYNFSQTAIDKNVLNTKNTMLSSANYNYFKGNCIAIGGLVGFNNTGNIRNSYSKIDVRNTNADYAGGAIGKSNGGRLRAIYATGSVLAKTTVGGFVAVIAENNSNIQFKNCVAVNNWLNSDNYSSIQNLGGFVGIDASVLTNSNVYKCYSTNYATVNAQTKDYITYYPVSEMMQVKKQAQGTQTYKESVYNGFSMVFWDGKSDEEIPYIRLIERSANYIFDVSDWEELDAVISARSNAQIKLVNDILVENIIDTEFTGSIYGNGYKFVLTTNDRKTEYSFKNISNLDANKSYLYNYVNNDENGDYNYCALFARTTMSGEGTNTSKATFKDVIVVVDKELEVNAVAGKDFNYIAVLVAYADNSIFENCKIQSTQYGSLQVEDNNTVTYYGTLVGYADNVEIK